MSHSVTGKSFGQAASVYVLMIGFALNTVAGFMVTNSAPWTWFVVAAGFLFISASKPRNVSVAILYPAIFLSLIVAIWTGAL
jgi:hypothetical protein